MEGEKNKQNGNYHKAIQVKKKKKVSVHILNLISLHHCVTFT